MENIQKTVLLSDLQSVTDLLISFNELNDEMKKMFSRNLTGEDLPEPIKKAALHAFDIEKRISPFTIPYSCLKDHFKSENEENCVGFVLSFHLMHIAAHTIDDIVDGDDYRNNSKSTHFKYGKGAAVLVATWLIYYSLRLANEHLLALGVSTEKRSQINDTILNYSGKVIGGTNIEIQSRFEKVDEKKWEEIAEKSVGSMLEGIWKIISYMVDEPWTELHRTTCSSLAIILRFYDDYYDMVSKRSDVRNGSPNLFLLDEDFSEDELSASIASKSSELLDICEKSAAMLESHLGSTTLNGIYTSFQICKQTLMDLR